MKLSLIITTYNWSASLSLVLKSIQNQTIVPNEIVIADDGSTNDTKEMIFNIQKKTKLNIIHSWQSDNGFRAARSRNKAISKSTGGYIILIDGDMILHPKFIQDHISNARPGFFIQGSRSLLSENATNIALKKQKIFFSFFSNGLSNRKNTLHSSLLSSFFSYKKNNLIGVKTCNMSFYKKDCINVNGFNNDFEGWGREDSEFVIRLMNNGIKRNNIRFCAIQYHLWHKENDRTEIYRNNLMLKNAINNRTKWCENGLTSLNSNES